MTVLMGVNQYGDGWVESLKDAGITVVLQEKARYSALNFAELLLGNTA